MFERAGPGRDNSCLETSEPLVTLTAEALGGTADGGGNTGTTGALTVFLLAAGGLLVVAVAVAAGAGAVIGAVAVVVLGVEAATEGAARGPSNMGCGL